MKYKVENSKMPLQQNEQKAQPKIGQIICRVPVIIPIFNIFMSRKAGVLLSSTRGKSLGTRLSFVSH
jgi:hypothetical protein